jgi:hypothetical protein
MGMSEVGSYVPSPCFLQVHVAKVTNVAVGRFEDGWMSESSRLFEGFESHLGERVGQPGTALVQQFGCPAADALVLLQLEKAGVPSQPAEPAHPTRNHWWGGSELDRTWPPGCPASAGRAKCDDREPTCKTAIQRIPALNTESARSKRRAEDQGD